MNSTVQAEPKFFSKAQPETIEVCICVLSTDQLADISIKNLALEFITTYLKCLPKALSREKNNETLMNILGSIFIFMKNIPEIVDADWLRPSSGFKVDDDELETDPVHSGMRSVDVIIGSIGASTVIPLL